MIFYNLGASSDLDLLSFPVCYCTTRSRTQITRSGSTVFIQAFSDFFSRAPQNENIYHFLTSLPCHFQYMLSCYTRNYFLIH